MTSLWLWKWAPSPFECGGRVLFFQLIPKLNIQLTACIYQVQVCTDSPISLRPPSHHSTAAKSQHITKSDDYIAIHSYYPGGGKHERFRAAAAAAAVRITTTTTATSTSISHLPGLFFPEPLTTNDSGATPEHAEWQCAPGASGRDASIIKYRWTGWRHFFPESQTTASSSSSYHAAICTYLREAFIIPPGNTQINTLCQQAFNLCIC